MSNKTVQSVVSVTIISKYDETVIDNNDIKHLYFIEDMFSYLMTGKIILTDTRALVEMLPLVGNEQIRIEYGTADDSGLYDTKEFEFDIIKMGDIESKGDKHRNIISLFFIQSPHKNLHMEHYSRSFKSGLYTDYVKWILKNHCGIENFVNFESGKETLPYFYTGLKTPAQNIEWLSNRTSGSISGQPGYLLYASTEDPNNPYNYVTLEQKLMDNELMPPDAGYYTLHSHNEYNINRMLSFTDSRIDKRSLEKLIKYVGLGFDSRRKRYIKNEYTYQDGLDRFTCLGRFSLFDKNVDNIVSVGQDLTGEQGNSSVSTEQVMDNIYWGDWIKRYALQHTISVMIEGHSKRYCGGVIEVAWPSANDDEIYDKNMSGLCLVKSITHSFIPSSKPVYTQRMILMKNGYDRSDGNLTKASKTNTEGEQKVELSGDNISYTRGF